MSEKSIGGSLPPVLALSFIGDARHSLYIRKMLVEKGIAKSGELNALALGFVTAEAQAKAFSRSSVKMKLTDVLVSIAKIVPSASPRMLAHTNAVTMW